VLRDRTHALLAGDGAGIFCRPKGRSALIAHFIPEFPGIDLFSQEAARKYLFEGSLLLARVFFAAHGRNLHDSGVMDD